MKIDAGLDTGDILLQQETPILVEDTAETVAPRLAQMGANLMIETLRGLESGNIATKPQDHSKASLAPILRKEDGLIDFKRAAVEIWNRLRGFQPWPGAYTSFRGKHLQIHAAKPLPTVHNLAPAEIAVKEDQLVVGCGNDSALKITELQMEGKKRVAARDFIQGYKLAPRERLGGT